MYLPGLVLNLFYKVKVFYNMIIHFKILTGLLPKCFAFPYRRFIAHKKCITSKDRLQVCLLFSETKEALYGKK